MTAVGVALVVEGVICFAMPEVTRAAVRKILEMDLKVFRMIGLGAFISGLLIFLIATRI